MLGFQVFLSNRNFHGPIIFLLLLPLVLCFESRPHSFFPSARRSTRRCRRARPRPARHRPPLGAQPKSATIAHIAIARIGAAIRTRSDAIEYGRGSRHSTARGYEGSRDARGAIIDCKFAAITIQFFATHKTNSNTRGRVSDKHTIYSLPRIECGE